MRGRNASRGFTLVEVLAGVSIAALIGSLVGAGIAQGLRVAWGQNTELVAGHKLREGAFWFTHDAIQGQSTDLVAGAPPQATVSILWTDTYGGANTLHVSSYSLDGQGRLVRVFDGRSQVLSPGITSVSFWREDTSEGSTLYMALETQGARGRPVALTTRGQMRGRR